MGIRIHKFLGYGLDDVKCSKGYISDERFNLVDGYFSKDKDVESFEMSDFIKYIVGEADKEKKAEGFTMLTFDIQQLKTQKWDFYDVIRHESEFGMKKVVVFRPFLKDWLRYDDIIDYMEAKDCKNRLKVLDRPIFPYESWIDKNTGHPYIMIKGKKTMCHDIIRDLNFGFYRDDLGFKNEKEARENIVPLVPEIIRKYCEYLKVFKDKSTCLTLKPMIYTYWS